MSWRTCRWSWPIFVLVFSLYEEDNRKHKWWGLRRLWWQIYLEVSFRRVVEGVVYRSFCYGTKRRKRKRSWLKIASLMAKKCYKKPSSYLFSLPCTIYISSLFYSNILGMTTYTEIEILMYWINARQKERLDLLWKVWICVWKRGLEIYLLFVHW